MADEKDSVPAPKVPEPGRGVLGFIRGSFVRYPLIAILPSLVFLLVFIYIDFCLSLLVLPLFTVALLWLFRINKLWHQVAIGTVALLIASLLLTAVYVVIIADTPTTADGTDGVLTNGMVTPYRGTPATEYVFTVTVTSDASTVNAYLNVSGLYGEGMRNISMNLISHSASNHTRNYSVTANVEGAVSNFYFTAKTDGGWHTTYLVYGPVSSDSTAVFMALIGTMLVQILGYCFMQLLIMILFLRMSAKSKDARQKVMKDYMEKKEKLKTAQTGTKDSTEGATAGTEDTFVCSECGADVRATAKFCPNCGEPFDEEEKADAGTEKKQ